MDDVVVVGCEALCVEHVQEGIYEQYFLDNNQRRANRNIEFDFIALKGVSSVGLS